MINDAQPQGDVGDSKVNLSVGSMGISNATDQSDRMSDGKIAFNILQTVSLLHVLVRIYNRQCNGFQNIVDMTISRSIHV